MTSENFNKDHAKNTPKEEWLKQHEHITEIDLNAIYDELVPIKKAQVKSDPDK